MRIAFRILALFHTFWKKFVTQQKEEVWSSPNTQKYCKKSQWQSNNRLLIDLNVIINHPHHSQTNYHFQQCSQAIKTHLLEQIKIYRLRTHNMRSYYLPFHINFYFISFLFIDHYFIQRWDVEKIISWFIKFKIDFFS